jgi:predicted small secreted protein
VVVDECGSNIGLTLYWLLDTSVRKNGLLAVAHALVLISCLFAGCNSNRGRGKERFPFLQTTKRNSTVKRNAYLLVTYSTNTECPGRNRMKSDMYLCWLHRR